MPGTKSNKEHLSFLLITKNYQKSCTKKAEMEKSLKENKVKQVNEFDVINVQDNQMGKVLLAQIIPKLNDH